MTFWRTIHNSTTEVHQIAIAAVRVQGSHVDIWFQVVMVMTAERTGFQHNYPMFTNKCYSGHWEMSVFLSTTKQLHVFCHFQILHFSGICGVHDTICITRILVSSSYRQLGMWSFWRRYAAERLGLQVGCNNISIFGKRAGTSSCVYVNGKQENINCNKKKQFMEE